MRLFRILLPIGMMVFAVLSLTQIHMRVLLILSAMTILPVGVVSLQSDRKTNKKDEEFATFLRSTGSMASASGTTLKQSLTKIDISSFPALEDDIDRLSTRLQALVDPKLCWHKFGKETGSKLISDTTDIFYRAINIGGEPEHVGYWCSLFAAKTSQLRAKRRLIISTFAGLSSVMQAVVAGLMVFVMSIVETFAAMVEEMLPESTRAAANGQVQMSMGMAQFTPGELQFLATLTLVMVLVMAALSALSVILGDGGYRLKYMFYLSLTILISGVSYIFVPPLVAGMLAM